MKLSKQKIIFILIILTILVIFFLPKIFNPLRRSETSIKKYLIKKIPLETNYEEVKEILLKEKNYYSPHKWEIQRLDANSFCNHMSWHKIEFKNNKYNYQNCNKEFLDKNLFGEIYLDGYKPFLFSYTGKYGIWVHAFFVFDENEKLIDIEIYKEEVVD